MDDEDLLLRRPLDLRSVPGELWRHGFRRVWPNGHRGCDRRRGGDVGLQRPGGRPQRDGAGGNLRCSSPWRAGLEDDGFRASTPKLRLEDMDLDGMWALVIYGPSTHARDPRAGPAGRLLLGVERLGH